MSAEKEKPEVVEVKVVNVDIGFGDLAAFMFKLSWAMLLGFFPLGIVFVFVLAVVRAG